MSKKAYIRPVTEIQCLETKWALAALEPSKGDVPGYYKSSTPVF